MLRGQMRNNIVRLVMPLLHSSCRTTYFFGMEENSLCQTLCFVGGANALLELGSTDSPLKLAPVKRTKYDYKEEDGAQEDNTGYSPSHPGVHCGSEELELLKHYRKNSGSKAMPLIPAQQHTQPDSSTQNGKPKKIIQRTTRKSIEEGEVISDDEIEVELQEDEEVEDDYPETTLGWWLKEPLDPVSTTHPKLSPPPKPQVQLPLEALSRFYTKSTSLQKMSFEDRVMWLDPIYGNLQPVSGRYDRLRKLLGNKSAKK